MKKTARHSKNSLFLMEMVMVLLFLSLSGAACVRIFATARENRIQTQEWIHIQSLTTSTKLWREPAAEKQTFFSTCLEELSVLLPLSGIMTTPGNYVSMKMLLTK